MGPRTLAVVQRLWPSAAAYWAERLFFTPPRARRAGELPPGATAFTVRSGRRRLAAWRWGSGPAVILLHGWGGSSAQLAALVGPLTADGFGVVAFDAPAHGVTGGRLSSIPDFAGALRAVASQVGDVHAVVAHSLGGAAAAFAIRDGLQVPRLALLAPPANPTAWTRTFAARLGLGEDVLRRMRARAEKRLRFRWEALEVTAMLSRFLGKVLVVHDRDDAEVAWADGAAIAAAVPDGQLVSTGGLGHRRILRAPEVVEAVVGFVSRRGKAGATGEAACPGCGERPRRRDGLCLRCGLEQALFRPHSRADAWPAALGAGAAASALRQ